VTAAPRWEPVPYWGKIPHGMTFRGSATSVAVDSKDRVYVFNRGSHPLMVFDSDGNLLDTWDDRSMFTRPHSVFVDPGDDLWLVDDGGSFIDHRTRGGELIMRLGEKDNPKPKESNEPFNRPCDIGLHPVTGDIYIADGYGNSAVHRFSAKGEHIKTWGQSGTGPGEFSLPHHVLVTADDRILVCDRENFRIQVFDPDGKFIEHWHLHRPFCIAMGPPAAPYIFVGEARSVIPNREGIKRLGACVKALTLDGEVVAQFGAELPGFDPGQFNGIHGIAVDSHGDVYVAEVCESWLASYEGPQIRGEWVSLRKWRLVTD
jgi:hypothetical protein